MRTISYRRGPHHITVKVDAEKPTVCQACKGTFKGRRINTHHWKEEWDFPTVKANPILALENAAPFCINHHRVANSLRHITEELMKGRLTPQQLTNIINTMPHDMKWTLTKTLLLPHKPQTNKTHREHNREHRHCFETP